MQGESDDARGVNLADAAGRGWTECPGCGLSLPGAPARFRDRVNASAACWHLYGEVTAFEFSHLAQLSRHHQLLVDTYSAQHAGPGVPAIGPAFGLIGLWMALEGQASGLAVRAAHQYLAQHFQDWPRFERPVRVAQRTVFELALAESAADFERILREWALEVWTEWAPAHGAVAALVHDRLPSHVRDGLGSAG